MRSALRWGALFFFLAANACSTVGEEPGLKGDLARTIEAERGAFGACYEKFEVTGAGRTVELKSDFRIRADGSVADARVSRRNVLNPALETCVLGVVEKLRFKPLADGGTVDVGYPFRFKTTR